MTSKKVTNFLGINEMKDYKHVFRQLTSEFLGTFLYLALVLSAGIGATSVNSKAEYQAINRGTETILVALANGLMVASIVAVFGSVSGGHINPAVTVGALVCGNIKPLKALCYIAMQIAGSLAGAGVAYLVSSKIVRGNLGATIPMYIRGEQVFALEFLMTFLLVAVVLSVTDIARGARGLGSAPLAIGVCVLACMCACSPYTASMNPVRSFGPAVIMDVWVDHWAYWVGPMAGGLVAGLVYRFVLACYQHHSIVLSTTYTDIRRSTENLPK